MSVSTTTSDVSELDSAIFSQRVSTSSANPNYKLVDATNLNNLLSSVPCNECNFSTLEIKDTSSYGYSSKPELVCSTCDNIPGTTFTSQRSDNSRRLDINNKIAAAFAEMSKGHG